MRVCGGHRFSRERISKEEVLRDGERTYACKKRVFVSLWHGKPTSDRPLYYKVDYIGPLALACAPQSLALRTYGTFGVILLI